MNELSAAFLQALDQGHMDEDLAVLETRIRFRRATVGQIIFPTATGDGNFKPGERVITTDRIRPAYLQRRPGTLIRFKQKRWAFKPDDPSIWGRFLHPDGTTGLLPSQFRKEQP